MTRVLWQLLQEEPSTLDCDECLAVMEYYAELLVQGGASLLPEVMEHLEGCPSCRLEHREALEQLIRAQEREANPTRMSMGMEADQVADAYLGERGD